MKKTHTLIALFCLLAVNTIGQNSPVIPGRLSQSPLKDLQTRIYNHTLRDSTPCIPHLFQPAKVSPVMKKSTPQYKKKMDSLLCQELRGETGVLDTLNSRQFAYDAAGRLTLDITYSYSSWDSTFSWYKDSMSYDHNGNQVFDATYTREQRSDPWVLEYQYERFFDEKGNDTLEISYEKEWDTDRWTSTKMVLSYNENNDVILGNEYKLIDSTGVWENFFRIEATYASKGLPASYSYWFNHDGVMVQEIQIEYTYGINDLVTSFIYYSWNFDEQKWFGVTRQESTYDANGNCLLYLEYGNGDANNNWTFQNKVTKAFDEKNNELERVEYRWSEETSQWTPLRRETQTYDVAGNQTEDIRFNWDSEGSQWVPTYKTTLEYNAAGQEVNQVRLEWNQDKQLWAPATKQLTDYDANGNTILLSYCNWDTVAENWLEIYHVERVYDAYGDITHTLSMSSKDSTGQWVEQIKSDYFFNYSYSKDEIASIYSMEEDAPAHMVENSITYEWDAQSGQWVIGQTNDYYYSDFGNSGITDISLSAIHVYPNPAIDRIFVELSPSSGPAQLELFDLNGRKMLSEKLIGVNNQVSIIDLPSGVYIYQLVCNGECSYGKIVKK